MCTAERNNIANLFLNRRNITTLALHHAGHILCKSNKWLSNGGLLTHQIVVSPNRLKLGGAWTYHHCTPIPHMSSRSEEKWITMWVYGATGVKQRKQKPGRKVNNGIPIFVHLITNMRFQRQFESILIML